RIGFGMQAASSARGRVRRDTAAGRRWIEDNLTISKILPKPQAVPCLFAALREVGLLYEQFWAYAEDLDWSARFLGRGYRLAFAPKAHLWHLDGATSVKLLGSGSEAVRQFLSTRNMVFVARKHVRWYQLPTYILGFILKHIAF